MGFFVQQLDLFEKCEQKLMESTQKSSSGRTSLEVLAQTMGMISRPSSLKSQRAKFQCLDLADGQRQEWSELQKQMLPGELSTLNFGESPSIVKESFLSQILQDRVEPRYSLSPKACLGVLRRAKKQGKKLSEPLLSVLLRQSSVKDTENRGGKGILLSERCLTLGTTNDLIVYNIAQTSDVVRESQNSPCLTSRRGVEHPVYNRRNSRAKGSACYGLGDLQGHQKPMKEKGATVTCMHQPPPSHGYLRKLTPLECERLQGLPDGWTEGGSNTARYKAIGNGMAQPCADFVMWCAMKILEEK